MSWVTLVDIADTVCAGNLMWYYTVDTYVNNALALLAPWQYHTTAISSSMCVSYPSFAYEVFTSRVGSPFQSSTF